MEGGAARPSLVLAEPILATGDLDGDGTKEAVALLAESSGGSGTFSHLVVVGRRSGRLSQLAAVPIGDRVQVRTAAIDGRRILLEVVQAGAEDAACCPTQKATRVWEFGSGGIRELPPVMDGTVSLSDLEGMEWVLKRLAWKEPAPPGPEVTLVFENGRVSGSSFCNRYSADVSETAPEEITFGKIGSTRRAFPDSLASFEGRFLQALRHVRRYSFLATRLALTSEQDGVLETLIFAARPAGEESRP